MANLLYPKRIQSASWIVAGNPRLPAVHHQTHVIDSQRSFRNISRNDYLAAIASIQGSVLLLSLTGYATVVI